MGDFPILNELVYDYSGTVEVVAPNSNNSKGNYAQLTASLSENTSFFFIRHDYVNYNQRYLIDMAIGAAGSEKIIIADIPILGIALDAAGVYTIPFPMRLKKGVRVAFRCQSDYKLSKKYIGITTFKYDTLFESYRVCDTIGTVSGSSRGTSVDPGGVANTWGAYTELVASSANNYKALMLMALPTFTFGRVATRRVKIAIGAAGSEVDIGLKGVIGADGQNDYGAQAYPWMLPISIKAGTRISAAAICSSASAGREAYVTLFGLY